MNARFATTFWRIFSIVSSHLFENVFAFFCRMWVSPPCQQHNSSCWILSYCFWWLNLYEATSHTFYPTSMPPQMLKATACYKVHFYQEHFPDVISREQAGGNFFAKWQVWGERQCFSLPLGFVADYFAEHARCCRSLAAIFSWQIPLFFHRMHVVWHFYLVNTFTEPAMPTRFH